MFSSEQEGSEEGCCNEDNTWLDKGRGRVEGAVGALVGAAHLRKIKHLHSKFKENRALL